MFMKNVKDKNQSFSSLAVLNHKGFDPDVPEISDSDNNDTYILDKEFSDQVKLHQDVSVSII